MAFSKKCVAMIHQIIASVPDGQFEITKLHAILWFSDREAFLKLGHTISGGTYIRKAQGPVFESLDEILASLTAVSDPSVLTQEELAIIDAQINRIQPLTAEEASKLSRDYTWRMFEDDENIDMILVLAKPGEVTTEGLAWAFEKGDESMQHICQKAKKLFVEAFPCEEAIIDTDDFQHQGNTSAWYSFYLHVLYTYKDLSKIFGKPIQKEIDRMCHELHDECVLPEVKKIYQETRKCTPAIQDALTWNEFTALVSDDEFLDRALDRALSRGIDLTDMNGEDVVRIRVGIDVNDDNQANIFCDVNTEAPYFRSAGEVICTLGGAAVLGAEKCQQIRDMTEKTFFVGRDFILGDTDSEQQAFDEFTQYLAGWNCIQLDTNDLKELGKAVENALGSQGQYISEVQEKFAEMGITDDDQAMNILHQIPMVTFLNNMPGYMPDNEPFSEFAGLAGEIDYTRIREVLASEIEQHYDDTDYEEAAQKLAEEVRSMPDEKIQNGITIHGPDGHVFEATFSTAGECCQELQVLKPDTGPGMAV